MMKGGNMTEDKMMMGDKMAIAYCMLQLILLIAFILSLNIDHVITSCPIWKRFSDFRCLDISALIRCPDR
jgi:hypothetical protein